MSDTLKLYELPGSPNNKKARIALNYKEIPFEQVLIEFQRGVPIHQQDRHIVVEASRQPLTPTLKHGERVIFDSGAILRYLEANFPDRRPLFSNDYATMKKIEQWEWFGRTQLNQPVGIIFGLGMSGESDPAEIERANTLLHELTAKTEEQLGKTKWIVGDEMTAADVTAGPYLSYSMLPPEAAEVSPLHAFFYENLKLGQDRPKTRDWVSRIMTYDR